MFSQKPKVKIIDNALVIACKSNDMPCICRVEFLNLEAANFSLKKEKDNFLLMFKNAGKEEDLASFETAQSADYVMDEIAKAMMKGTKKSSWFKKFFWGGLVIVLFLFFLMKVTSFMGSNGEAPIAIQQQLMPNVQSGVPMTGAEMFGGK